MYGTDRYAIPPSSNVLFEITTGGEIRGFFNDEPQMLKGCTDKKAHEACTVEEFKAALAQISRTPTEDVKEACKADP